MSSPLLCISLFEFPVAVFEANGVSVHIVRDEFRQPPEPVTKVGGKLPILAIYGSLIVQSSPLINLVSTQPSRLLTIATLPDDVKSILLNMSETHASSVLVPTYPNSQ